MNAKAEIQKAVEFGMATMCREFEVQPPAKFIRQTAKDYANELIYEEKKQPQDLPVRPEAQGSDSDL